MNMSQGRDRALTTANAGESESLNLYLGGHLAFAIKNLLVKLLPFALGASSPRLLSIPQALGAASTYQFIMSGEDRLILLPGELLVHIFTMLGFVDLIRVHSVASLSASFSYSFLMTLMLVGLSVFLQYHHLVGASSVPN